MDSTQQSGRADSETESDSAQPAVTGLVARPWFSPVLLAILTVIAYARVWSAGHGSLPGAQSTDLASYFVYARQFGFDQLRHGHLPLINPHIAAGVPFMGDWQSALLYPPNWIYLFLPLPAAINLESMGHVFLTGLFTSMWLRKNGLHPAAALVGATSVMLGGPFFLHVYAGHVSAIDAMAWTPLILLAIESLMEADARPLPRRAGWISTTGWVLAGAAALAMQILAGHPQTVFFTLVIGAIYALVLLVRRTGRWPGLLLCAVTAALAVGLAYPQIATGLQAASEGVRQGPLPYFYAAGISFEPRNLITALVPHAFGGPEYHGYWSAWYPWEMSLYLGAAVFVLMCYGVTRAEGSRRATWAIMAGVALLLALGSHTSLFALLYRFVPGFDKFRSEGKFAYEAALFLAGLAAMGMDALLGGKRPSKGFVMSVGVVALLLTCAAVVMFLNGQAVVDRTVADTVAANSSFLPPGTTSAPGWAAHAAAMSGFSFLIGALIVASVYLLLRTATRPYTVAAIAAIAVVELAAYAAWDLTGFPIAATQKPELGQFIAQHPGDYRVLIAGDNNYTLATVIGADDIWGYDPAVFGRYGRYMAMTQNLDPSSPNFFFPIHRIVLSQSMLRLACAFVPDPSGTSMTVVPIKHSMPHGVLIHQATIASGPPEALADVSETAFDPHNQVVLEESPNPPLSPAAGPESVSVRRLSTDSLSIDATVSAPAILLVTDAYSDQYRVHESDGRAPRLRVVPADYTLIGIPIGAGHWKFDLTYDGQGLEDGFHICELSAFVYVVLLVIRMRQARGHAASNLDT